MRSGASKPDLRLLRLVLVLACSAACSGSGGSGDGEAEAANAAPQLETQRIQPREAYTDAALTVTGSAWDTDGDPVVVTRQWYVNGDPVATGDSLPGSAFVKGDRVRATVTASDGKDETTRSSGEVIILNSPPTPPEIEISPAEPSATRDDLICEIAVPSQDLDVDAVTYAIDWEVNGVPWEGPAESASRPGDRVPATYTRPGERWSCRVTPHDGEGTGQSVVAAVVHPFVIGEIEPRVSTSGDHYCHVTRLGQGVEESRHRWCSAHPRASSSTSA